METITSWFRDDPYKELKRRYKSEPKITQVEYTVSQNYWNNLFTRNDRIIVTMEGDEDGEVNPHVFENTRTHSGNICRKRERKIKKENRKGVAEKVVEWMDENLK